MRKTTMLAAVVALTPMFSGAAQAELKVFGGGNYQGSGKPVTEAFTAKTGIAATYTPGNTGGPALPKRLNAGEQMDVIIMTRDDMDNQVKAGLIRADSGVSFSRTRLGVAVVKGAPKPDISTPEKFRAAIIAAKAVGMQDPDPSHHSGQAVHKMLVDLNVVDEIKPKTVVITGVADALVAGKVDFSIWALPEIMANNKLDAVGGVPGGLGGWTDQAVGILTSAKDVPDAQAYIKFLTSPEGQAAWTKTGLDPLGK